MVKTYIFDDIYEKQLTYKSFTKYQPTYDIHSQTPRPILHLNTQLNCLHIFTQRRTDAEVKEVDTKGSEKHASKL